MADADEARIIPIKSEPATPVSSGEKAAPRKRATPRRSAKNQASAATPNNGSARTEAPAPAGDEPADGTPDRRAAARTTPRKASSDRASSDRASSDRASSDRASSGEGSRRRRAKAEPDAIPTAERDDGGVQPPEELHDLGSFVIEPESRRAEAERAEAEPPEAVSSPAPQPPNDVEDVAAQERAPERPEDPWERKVAGALAFLRRRLTGEYEVDEFGFDPELTATVAAAPFRPLYDKWFRVEVSGMDHVPDKGAALIVANHSGTIALDGVITALALLDHHPARRHLRMLGADLVFKTPFLGEFARKTGHTLACQADAERLLSSGELVGVYPEGFKGVGKPFSERYKLQRFGRGGFVSAALKTQAPIIPCAIVGAEEIYPMLGNSALLARLLGLPYFPLTPTFPWLGPLGMIPLPSKWYIEFGEPIETAPLADRADDPMLVFNVADQVRETIQQTLYRLLMNRKSVFS